MADLQDRHADAGQRQQVALHLFENGQRQHGRARGEVVDAVDRGGCAHKVDSRSAFGSGLWQKILTPRAWGRQIFTRCRSMISAFPLRIASSSPTSGAASTLIQAIAASAPSNTMF